MFTGASWQSQVLFTYFTQEATAKFDTSGRLQASNIHTYLADNITSRCYYYNS